jgi:citrate/tricarballylate utilization protein
MSLEPTRMSLPLLVSEVDRQLKICNACRYCEGFCAVFPALERRTEFSLTDVSQLANLCHDCRACFHACMYTPPHEFGVNVPKALAEVRLEDYRRYVWPQSPLRIFRGWMGIFSGMALAVLVLIAIAVTNVGFGGLIAGHETAASPYQLIPYPLLLVLVLIPTAYSVVVLATAGRRFWRSAGPLARNRAALLSATLAAVWYVLTMRYLRGGGAGCNYPEEDEPSARRSHLHAAVVYGFGLCLLSTLAAAVLQDFLRSDPPYSVLSVPVIAGLMGGVGLLAGSLGLLWLKTRAAQVMSVSEMTIKDYGLLTGLTFLALSGLATFLVRDTPAFDLVFLVHLGAVVVAFAAAPYSKFPHGLYRFLAIVRDNMERDQAIG